MLKCFPCIVEQRDKKHPNPHNVAQVAVTFVPSMGAMCIDHLYRTMDNADRQREAAEAELAKLEGEGEEDAGTRPGTVGQGES